MSTLKKACLKELKLKKKQCEKFDLKLSKESRSVTSDKARKWTQIRKELAKANMHLTSAQHQLETDEVHKFPYTFGQACHNLGVVYTLFQRFKEKQ